MHLSSALAFSFPGLMMLIPSLGSGIQLFTSGFSFLFMPGLLNVTVVHLSLWPYKICRLLQAHIQRTMLIHHPRMSLAF